MDDTEEVPSLDDLLGQLDHEQEVDDSRRKLAVDQDAIDEEAASYSVDQLLLRADADLARAVALFGPGVVALPLFGHISGVDGPKCLSYDAHPVRSSNGVLERLDMESKFGSLDPKTLIEELEGGERWLDRRLRGMKSEDIRRDIRALQEWRRKANGRLKTLTRRAAWAVLGIAHTQDQASIRRAFKRKALELHPDKGGDAQRFQLLQEMRDSLLLGSDKRVADQEELDENEEDAAEAQAGQPKEGAQDGAGNQSQSPGMGTGNSPEDDLELLERIFQRAARGEEDSDRDADVGEAAKSPDREELETARKKIHLSLVDAWSRSSSLAAELRKPDGQKPSSGGSIRSLRRFVDRFAASELTLLEEGDARKAERIFRRFLEQGSEVLCAAAALDADAAVAEVAGKVNAHLLAAARGKPELATRCARLLEALRSLAATASGLLTPVELQLSEVRSQDEPGQQTSAREEGDHAAAAELVTAKERDLYLGLDSNGGGEQADKAFLEGILASATRAAEAAVDSRRSRQGSQPTSGQDAQLEQARQRRLEEERRQQEADRRAAAEQRRRAQEDLDRREAEGEDDREEAKSRDLVVASDEDSPRALQRLRTEWEDWWEHYCAGSKRADGTAIFCEPCNCWVTVPPFDHTAFELHCEKAGHTDWID